MQVVPMISMIAFPLGYTIQSSQVQLILPFWLVTFLLLCQAQISLSGQYGELGGGPK